MHSIEIAHPHTQSADLCKDTQYQTFQVSRFDRDSPGLERTVPVSRSQVSRPGLRRPGVEIFLHSPHGRFSTEIIHSLPPNSAYIVRSTYRTHLHNRSWITQAFYREIAI